MTWMIDFYNRLAGVFGFAKVTPILPGKKNDGLINRSTSGTSLDKPWGELSANLANSYTAWRSNPMVRRLVGLITAFVVGPGIRVSSENKKFNKFIEEFMTHQDNRVDLRLADWCDELTRSGELFLVLYTDPLTGMSVVRTMPASLIEEVETDDDDYELELRYKQTTDPGKPPKYWISHKHPTAHEARADGKLQPWVLHYAVNRPVGTVRGEGDLVPILPWLRRYERWLEDRVRLNAAMRAFYWVVYAPARMRNALLERYSNAPPAGTIIVAEEGSEKWEPVTPKLNASDAKDDGRAIRWMIAAGGPGTGLADFGESEESGLTKGKDADEQRRRFLLRRQRYFTYMLSDLLVVAYNRWLAVGSRRYDSVDIGDVIVKAPDISTEDNTDLAGAASSLVTALAGLESLIGHTEDFKTYALRLFVKMTGESITDKEFEALLAGDPLKDAERKQEIETASQERVAKARGSDGTGGSGNSQAK